MSDFKKLSDNECAKLLTALHFFNTHDFTDKSYLDLENKLCNNYFDVIFKYGSENKKI